MLHRALVAAGLLLGGLLGAPGARASYTEAHQTGDDVRIQVEADGHARVEHTLTWRVLAGQKRTLELVGVEANAVPDARATVTAEDERELTAAVALRPSDPAPTLEVTLDDPKSLRKGKYRVQLAYEVDLVAARELVRDGAMWRLGWIAPVAQEGFDGAHVVFDLPGSTTEPRAVRSDSDAPEDSILSILHRDVDRDALELVRPHVARGEAVQWSVLVAPGAVAGLHAAPREVRASAPRVDRARFPLAVACILGLALAYGALVRRKEAMFAAACHAVGAGRRGILPLPSWARPVLAGAALSVGTVAQATGSLVPGSLLVGFAMLCAAVGADRVADRVRGPGRWLALRPEETFVRPARQPLDVFDAGTWAGKACFLAGAALVAGAGLLLRRMAPSAPYVAAIDTLALVPLFATGGRGALPPSIGSVAMRLWPIFRRLARNRRLRVAPWARVPTGAHEPDEIRVLVLPRMAMPGVLGIEVGLACGAMPNEYATLPEVLVRVNEASAASARMTTLVPRLVPFPGRRPDERVYRLVPRFPTTGWTRALVERVAGHLVDRRGRESEWEGAERRVPPSTERGRQGERERAA